MFERVITTMHTKNGKKYLTKIEHADLHECELSLNIFFFLDQQQQHAYTNWNILSIKLSI